MITPESHEWVLLSAVYHHVLALSSSPEQAKIDISNARDNGRLRFQADRHEHVAMPGLGLEPGEQPPDELMITSNQPLPKDNLYFDEWDWEKSRAITRNDPITNAVFEYVDIVVHRDDALALWPASAAVPAIIAMAPAQAMEDGAPEELASKRGTKAKYDWEALQAKFYLMADDDALSPSSNPNYSAYTKRIVEWAAEQFGEKNTPDEETIRPKVKSWFEIYLRTVSRK